MKKFLLGLLIVLGLVLGNHMLYGTRSVNFSIIELFQHNFHTQVKLNYSKEMAKHIYNRIKFYQEIDNYYERLDMIWFMYNAIQQGVLHDYYNK